MKNNEIVKLVFRFALFAVAVVSVVLSFTLPNMTEAKQAISPFLYYTNWSVYLACLSSLIGLAVTGAMVIGKKNIDNSVFEGIQFAALIMIIATFIVSAFVLPNKIWMAGYWTLTSIFKHFLLPILIVVDYVLFAPKGSARLAFPFTSLIAPLAYWIILIIRFMAYRSSQGGAIPEAEWPFYYPYGFTNVDNGHSLGGLIGLLAGILVGLILIGFLFYFLKKAKKDAK